MGEFFVYILKSSVCLSLFYLFYRLLLSKETFHRFNRLALLGMMVLSVVIPFFQVITKQQVAIQQPLLNLEYLLQMAEVQTVAETPTLQSVWLQGLFLAYVCGCVFFFLRFIYSISAIIRVIRGGEKIALEDGIRLVITSQQISPFSWMKYIIVSRKDINDNESGILLHEKAHIKACHSFDMQIASLCMLLHWFNPAAWLFKRELQNIHEFEADANVLEQGVDARQYQLLLIKKAVGPQRFTSVVNSFNHSELKKRIAMMLKQKSNSWARLKSLCILPLTAIAVVAFARPEVSRELDKIADVNLNEVSLLAQSAKVEEPHQPKVVAAAKVQQKKVKVAKEKPVEEKKQESTEPKAEEQAEAKIKVVGSTVKVHIADTINSNELPEKIQLNPDDLKLFDKEAVPSLSGLKEPGNLKNKPSDATAGSAGKGVRSSSFVIHPKGKNPLVIIDGQEQPDGALDKINPANIESISILKDEVSIKKYGEKAVNGVVVVRTKQAGK